MLEQLSHDHGLPSMLDERHLSSHGWLVVRKVCQLLPKNLPRPPSWACSQDLHNLGCEVLVLSMKIVLVAALTSGSHTTTSTSSRRRKLLRDLILQYCSSTRAVPE